MAVSDEAVVHDFQDTAAGSCKEYESYRSKELLVESLEREKRLTDRGKQEIKRKHKWTAFTDENQKLEPGGQLQTRLDMLQEEDTLVLDTHVDSTRSTFTLELEITSTTAKDEQMNLQDALEDLCTCTCKPKAIILSLQSQHLSKAQEASKTSIAEDKIDMVIERDEPNRWELKICDTEGHKIKLMQKENNGGNITNLEKLRVRKEIGDEEECHRCSPGRPVQVSNTAQSLQVISSSDVWFV